MDSTPGTANKRRKVNTCTNCRRRKVQCDQASPACGRCIRTNKAETCMYLEDDDTIIVASNSGPLAASTLPTRAPEVNAQHSIQAQVDEHSKQIRRLEEALASTKRELVLQNTRHDDTDPGHLPVQPEHRSDSNVASSEITGVKGSLFKTRFFGTSYPKSLLSHIPGLTALSKEIVIEHPVLKKIRKDVQYTDIVKAVPTASADIDLKGLLPLRAEADELVHLYLDTFDNIYHILHRPSFLEEYEHLWTDPSQARAHFVALALLMTASARSLKREEPCLYVGKNSVARHQALAIINTCEDWLRRNEKQKKATITNFQIRLLVCLGKAVHGAQFKKGWEEATTMLRRAMAAGLHVEPSKTTPDVQEMRRRIWCATAEFELHASFVRGMPADPLSLEGNVKCPSNIDDDHLIHGISSLPQAQPDETFTGISYLVLVTRSFSLRHALTRVLNAPTAISFDQARTLTEEIEMHIQHLPEWSDTPNSEAPRALLKANLMSYLLVLHNRHFEYASCAADRSYSAMVIMRYATEMTSIHNTLLESGSRVLLQLSHEELRTALSICHLVERLDPGQDAMLYHTLQQISEQVTSCVVELVADKARLGAGRNKYWLALVADAFVKIWKRPVQRAMCISEAVNTLAASSYKVIASQTAAEPAVGGASEFKGPVRIGAMNGLGQGAAPVLQHDEEGVSTFSSMDDFSAWTFEDWAFESQHFEALSAPM